MYGSTTFFAAAWQDFPGGREYQTTPTIAGLTNGSVSQSFSGKTFIEVKLMTTATQNKLSSLFRLVALATSAIAAGLVAFTFGSDSQITFHVKEYFTSDLGHANLLMFVASTVLVALGYLVATSKRFLNARNWISLTGLAAMFILAQTNVGFLMSPFALALAAPAVFHWTSGFFHRAAQRSKTTSTTDASEEAFATANCTNTQPLGAGLVGAA